MKTNELKQRVGAAGTILLAYLFVLCLSVWGQAPSSRQIPFSGVVTTIQGPLPAQTLTLRVLDNSNPPVALYCETQTLDVDGNNAITFILGTGTAVNPPCPSAPPGLNPADFASGSTRSLDVLDQNGNSVLPNPIPLKQRRRWSHRLMASGGGFSLRLLGSCRFGGLARPGWAAGNCCESGAFGGCWPLPKPRRPRWRT